MCQANRCALDLPSRERIGIRSDHQILAQDLNMPKNDYNARPRAALWGHNYYRQCTGSQEWTHPSMPITPRRYPQPHNCRCVTLQPSTQVARDGPFPPFALSPPTTPSRRERISSLPRPRRPPHFLRHAFPPSNIQTHKFYQPIQPMLRTTFQHFSSEGPAFGQACLQLIVWFLFLH
jgi:hypothetical protein